MNESQAKIAKSLAEDHWRYMEEILVAYGAEKGEIRAARFHYISAFVHGYKHAIEDVEASKEDMVPPQIYHEERGMERLNNGG